MSTGSSDQPHGVIIARVVGTLWTWRREQRELLFADATANPIDILPAALLREGVFDVPIFVDLPTRAVREGMLSAHFTKKRRKR